MFASLIVSSSTTNNLAKINLNIQKKKIASSIIKATVLSREDFAGVCVYVCVWQEKVGGDGYL